MKKIAVFLVALTNCLLAFSPSLPYSPAEISQELAQANRDLAQAQKMFNPWYTGPILAGSASMMPPGMVNFQPYLFVQDNHAHYDGKRKSLSVPNVWQVNPNFIFQTGLTSWMDFSTVLQFSTNHKGTKWHTGFGDTPVSVGFRVSAEGLYMPKMKLAISETFPTGKYQYLTPFLQGLDAIGGGSYVTGISYRISKIFFWWTRHPVATRLVMTYNIPSSVRVHEYNTYGGGKGTSGKVRPGNSFNTDLGLELSLSERWVVATDIVYQTTKKTTFKGATGIDPLTGYPNTLGANSSDFLQIAPAIEYSWNDSFGVIAGAWFPVYGRNTSNFMNYVFSLTYSFGLK